MVNITAKKMAEEIFKYCIENGKKFIFISGNGASGKSELSNLICQVAGGSGYVNTIDMDDFVVDTKLRKSALIEWSDSKTGEKKSGSYSTVFAASYFLQNIKAIICNLRRGNNYWYWPKRAKSEAESVVELKSDAVITIIEGIGSVYLDKNPEDSISIFMRCSKENEIERRIIRAKYSNEKNREEVERQYEERNCQFESIILPYMDQHDLILVSQKDFSLNVVEDKLSVIHE